MMLYSNRNADELDDPVLRLIGQVGEGDVLGDAFFEISPGEELYGVPYEVIKAAIEVEGSFEIEVTEELEETEGAI